jgi:hypothetical protein
MFMFLVLLVAYFVLLGVYVGQNHGPEPVSLFVWSWPDIRAWVPAGVAGLAMFVLMAAWGSYGRTRHGIRHWFLGRRISEHQSEIADLRAENEHLRRQLARLQGELDTAARVVSDA